MIERKNDTTVGDVLKDHFGVNNIREARERRNSILEQERAEEMRVAMGNAPAAPAGTQGFPQNGVTYQATPPAAVTGETTQDSKCQSCGGTLSYDPETGGLVCNFCGSRTQINTIPAVPGLGYTMEDLQNNVGRRLRYGTKQVVCGTCGGSFIAEVSSMSGLCPFCGSNSITESGDSAGVLEPTGVIPFSISKEQAQATFKQWIAARRFAPMDIAKNAEITDLVGVYVPYWVFDCDTYTPYSGKFGKTYGSGDDQYTKYHKSSGVCQMPVKNLTLLASSRLEKDSFWKSVSKFNFSLMKRYDPVLLSGFWSESYTIEGAAAWQTAMNKIYERIRREIKNIEDADTIARIDMQPSAGNIRAKYVLAPIWITSFDYKGTIYRILVNGQTGDIVGTWPKSMKKFFLILGIIFGAIFGTSFLRALIMTFINWIKTLG